MSNPAISLSPNQEARKARLSLLARAPAGDIKDLWAAYRNGQPDPDHAVLRGPEIGAVMVRGRAGAVGAPFNLGEMTVARCSVRLPDGTVGHGHIQGRDKEVARIIALIDALCEAGLGQDLSDAILVPLSARAEAQRADRAAKAAATKVEFFTMVRGES